MKKRFDEMLKVTNSLEKNINELMELKTQHKNFAKHIQVSVAKLTKQKKGYQKSKITQ